ncbi:MAG: efflux RND transporter periplasmic adaptor subunit [Clostridiales Family XIII bacterium]|jgi:RND family efflux transporter MFP subunit|nr:efflux RND transporter periplasmic adaptor subunit [Clostridiales Family XIII bacterium]
MYDDKDGFRAAEGEATNQRGLMRYFGSLKGPKRKKAAIVAGAVLLCVLLAGAAAWNLARHPGGGAPRNALPVEIEAAHVETLVCKATVKGAVELSDVATIFPRGTSRVKAVHVEAGDAVRAGQRLLDYDSDALDELKNGLEDARLALRSAESSLAAARRPASDAEKIRLGAARAEYARMKVLYDEGGAVSKKDVDAAYDAMMQAESQVASKQDAATDQKDSAQVAVEQARANVARLEDEIAKCDQYETAPRDGTVISVSVKSGDVSSPGRPLLEIADVSAANLIIKANVPENDARDLAIGQTAEIRCDAISNDTFFGTVSKISPIAEKKQVGDAIETALTVEIACDEPGLKSGYSVDAAITTRVIEDAVVIPLMAAMSGADGKNYVFVMRDDYSVEKREAKLGEYSGIYVEAANVAAGERIVLSPPSTLAEGSFVRPASDIRN